MKKISMRLYCAVVNGNEYVREEYQLPNIINPDYHRKHRFSEWWRLSKLLLKYRVFKKKPTPEKKAQIQEMKNKLCERENPSDFRKIISERFRSETDKIKASDFIRLASKGIILCVGNSSKGKEAYAFREIRDIIEKRGYNLKPVCLYENKTADISLLPSFGIPVDVFDKNLYSEKNGFSLTREEERITSALPGLDEACQRILETYAEADIKAVKFVVSRFYDFYRTVIETFSPQAVFWYGEIQADEPILRQAAGDCDTELYIIM